MPALKTLCLALVLLMPALPADPVTDDAIYDRVRIQLANDREVGGGKIDVKVSKGVVELTGKVRTEKQKTKAEKVAKKVKGVQKVVNNLQVSPI